MKYTLVHLFPSGEERPVSIPFQTVGKAAAAAARSLHDNGRATKEAAQNFAGYLAKMPTGKVLKHGPSGYAARIELAEKVTAPDQGNPLRVTKPQRVQYLSAWAEVWEARTHGPASVRTLYLRWVEDGEHWITHDPVMFEDGSFYTGGENRRHAAGDLYARTVQGEWRRGTFHILVPERQLPQDAPTDQLLLPVT
ncbi:hypothetical protein P1P68_05895 [Streptomyces scabiei]|uniref:hypothetical protein n=1 Tax=Streptomyces scabiei TaxID=1930 RepID=UPI00299006BB|nr:hypothetical protein [Streptomyces scabiei]MDW8804334.1 hypothetical protein [Streptomyces scabiei]